ncbi:MAG: hypothetical protein V4726_10565 [Verrucomicrobiota bacterium]
MKGTPPLTIQRQCALPASQWSAGLGTSLREGEVLHQASAAGMEWEIRRTPSCVWVILTISKSFRLGVRAIFCPTGLGNVRLVNGKSMELEFTAEGGLGKYHVRGTFLEGSPPMLRLITTLNPGENIRITAAPRDLCVFDAKLNPYHGEGRLFTCQTGNSAAQAFFSPLEKEGATVFYFQNLSALTDYFRRTGARPGGCVGGEWPEAGFTLPAGENPLESGGEVTIADAFVCADAGLRAREVDAALMFLDSLARIYPLLPQPAWDFCDWPDLARATMRSLTGSAACTRVVGGKKYVEAYVGSSYKPPESMVQGALIVPLMEYAEWRERPVPLLEELRHVPGSFYDPRLKEPVRWLAGAEFTKEERSEEEHRFRMDSWYLLHTVMNQGRMAEMGWENAREVFFKSLPALMRAARQFDYDWPVFYDQRNLKIFKAETQDGEGGERDASGLYIHIMLQAHILTHDQEYLDEAETAARKLEGLAFGVLYQTNNTVFGAVALARLWRATGNAAYRDLGIVSLASTFSHLWLWNLGKDTHTFMALPPLHDAPYVAFYEEAEILAGLQTYQKEMREAMPESLSLLIAEYQKHLLARGRFYFPSELPEKLLVKKPKEGIFNARLHIPLEGLGGPGDQAGTVGQAVYAAAAPFILAARCWHRVPGLPLMVFCGYPALEVEFSGNRRAGSLKFRTGGSRRLSCPLRILPGKPKAPALKLEVDGKPHRVTGKGGENGDGISAEIPGDALVEVSWGE